MQCSDSVIWHKLSTLTSLTTSNLIQSLDVDAFIQKQCCGLNMAIVNSAVQGSQSILVPDEDRKIN